MHRGVRITVIERIESNHSVISVFFRSHYSADTVLHCAAYRFDLVIQHTERNLNRRPGGVGGVLVAVGVLSVSTELKIDVRLGVRVVVNQRRVSPYSVYNLIIQTPDQFVEQIGLLTLLSSAGAVVVVIEEIGQPCNKLFCVEVVRIDDEVAYLLDYLRFGADQIDTERFHHYFYSGVNGVADIAFEIFHRTFGGSVGVKVQCAYVPVNVHTLSTVTVTVGKRSVITVG